MSRCFTFLPGLFLAIAALLAGSASGAEDDAYCPPQQFVRNRDLRDFPQYAESYLKTGANQEEAPQVLLDLLVAHGAMRQNEKAQHVRARLILDHPASIQAGFVIGTLQDMDSFRELLKVSLPAYQATGQLGYRYLDKLSQGILYGQSQYGDSFFSEDELRLLAIYALKESGHGDPGRLHRSFKTKQQHLLRAAEILVDGKLSAADKLLKLQECRKSQIVRGIQACCLAQIPSRERGSAAIETVLVENLLDEGELTAALPRIEGLLAQKREARYLVWQAWSLFAAGRIDDATQSLAAVQQKFPADPWAKPARELHAALLTHPENLAAHVEALDRILVGIRENGLAAMQGEMHVAADDGQRLRVSLGIDVDRREAAGSIWRNDELLISLQSNSAGSRLYYVGEQTVHAYPDLWQALMPSFRLDRTPEGKIGFSWHMGSAADTASIKDQVLRSPILRDRRGVEELVASFKRWGMAPAEPFSRDGQTVYRWLSPQAASPELVAYDLILDQEHRIVRLDLGGWMIDRVRYGTSQQVSIAPPKWPDVPVQQHPQIGAELFRLMAAIVELLPSDDPPAVAAQR